jgi:hypothetical protein
VVRIVTGVVRAGDIDHYPNRAPQIPAVVPAFAPKDDEFQED